MIGCQWNKSKKPLIELPINETLIFAGSDSTNCKVELKLFPDSTFIFTNTIDCKRYDSERRTKPDTLTGNWITYYANSIKLNVSGNEIRYQIDIGENESKDSVRTIHLLYKEIYLGGMDLVLFER